MLNLIVPSFNYVFTIDPLLMCRLNGLSFKGHTKNIGIWGSFLTISLVVYLLLSSGDFSFLLVSTFSDSIAPLWTMFNTSTF